ncbi:ATP-binding protein [Dictyobacter formicarum]|uniref:IstB helper protein n=1 Tax=Dictyobacter formicarum TaxID=2778368 RepID=A0ABQ3VA32_9CHLR|nr:ATP-binding protein [Dictyobacter formicarum]GHO82566.1 IstB helper protein [Dictyobacter formicarum]
MLALEERFMIREMYRKGVSISEIARRTGRDRKTVRQAVNAPELSPPKHSRQVKACKIDPYIPYLEQRMTEGVLNARKLYGEILAQGYPGKESKVREFVHDRRPEKEPAGSMGVAAIMQGMSVVFFTVADLMDLVQQDSKEDRLERRLHALCTPKLLILDEMGYVPLDQRSAQFLFRLISRRYQKGSIILTSNKSYGEWGDVVSDYVLATAMLDRLLHYSTTINIRGESYRLREKRKAGVFHDLPAKPTKDSPSTPRKTQGEGQSGTSSRYENL